MKKADARSYIGVGSGVGGGGGGVTCHNSGGKTRLHWLTKSVPQEEEGRRCRRGSTSHTTTKGVKEKPLNPGCKKETELAGLDSGGW